jgi:hypothetical protein
METTYILTSNHFDGYISYRYNADGLLIGLNVCSYSLDPEKLEKIWSNYVKAYTVQGLKDWVNKIPAFKIVLEPVDLSFTRWYNLYMVKRNRIDAEKLWNAMSDSEKAVAMVNTLAYNRYCARNSWYTKMYPDTFLRKHWRDEWDKA